MSADHSLAEAVDNLVHEPAQVHDHGVDLTVSAVYDVAGPGRLDFGGDELEDADLEPHPSAERNPDDEYEWWDLEGGQYVLQYNEFLSGDPPLPPAPQRPARPRGVPPVAAGLESPPADAAVRRRRRHSDQGERSDLDVALGPRVTDSSRGFEFERRGVRREAPSL